MEAEEHDAQYNLYVAVKSGRVAVDTCTMLEMSR